MYFYQQAGAVALGSRLRRLADLFMQDAGSLYQHYGVDLDARWFPAFYTLMLKQQASVTEIAQDIGQSHASVSQVVRQMRDAELVQSQKCPDDGRKTLVRLSERGRVVARRLQPQCDDVGQAAQALLDSLGVDFWTGLQALEQQLSQREFVERVHHVRKDRQRQQVRIVDYQDRHAEAFRALNIRWIEQHWQMEDADWQALNHPQSHIIDPGGYIAIALLDDQVVGTCALLKKDANTFELAKMAVAEQAKGSGIGERLGLAVIDEATRRGAGRVYLESNTVLEPAINLYRKLGFVRIAAGPSPYERCNIQMELILPG